MSKAVTADRGIEERKRRNLGEFYTPIVWVDEGYKMIDKALGKGWEERYTVWDSSCGTGNLTSGRGIKHLYNSTLIAEDFEYGTVEGDVFQYDFLNDDVVKMEVIRERLKNGFGYNKEMMRGTKLYKEVPSLVERLEQGKPMIFIINPPYKAANNIKTRVRGESVNIKGGTSTEVRSVMQKDRTNLGAGQLYAQFLYRVHMLREIYPSVEINILLYSKQRVMTADMMSGLRDVMYEDFTITDSFSFRANEFQGCSGKWAVLCSLWEDKRRGGLYSGETKLKEREEGVIKELGKQELYTVEKSNQINEWVQEPLKGVETTKEAIYLSNGFKAYHKASGNGRAVKDFLGGFFSKSNVVEKNNNFVVITSEMMGDGSSKNITKANLDRVVSAFAARKLITNKYANWKNDSLEYQKPDESKEWYAEWLRDSYILSIFHNDSYQTSVSGLEYQGRKWDIKNEFFFMSREELNNLSEDHKGCLKGLKEDEGERYLYTIINEIRANEGLSKEAENLLSYCEEMVRVTIPRREQEEYREYHLERWDAGWTQVKRMLTKEEYNEYYRLLGELEDKMRPWVRELGFLR